jgi:hypothetical protein
MGDDFAFLACPRYVRMPTPIPPRLTTVVEQLKAESYREPAAL